MDGSASSRRRGGSRLVSIGLIGLGLLLMAAAPTRGYRRADWPHWQRIEGCRDTREVVLARDARPGSVQWSEDGCRVVAGVWLDPYTQEILTDPAALDVDHVIALAEASQRGGAAWSREKKAEYANALGYRYHLRAVDAGANRAKGAQGADAWTPDPRDWCQYGQARATIAVLSQLSVSETERTAIAALVATC